MQARFCRRHPLIWLIFAVAPSAMALNLYVATDGDDRWSGRRPKRAGPGSDGPFATLVRARDEVRRLRASGKLRAEGVEVRLLNGVYFMEQTLELDGSDSGTAESPVVYRGPPGQKAVLSGGRAIRRAQKLDKGPEYERLPQEAQGNVYVTDLRSLGMTDYGEPSGGFNRPAGMFPGLYYCGEPMPIARGPNDDFETIAKVVGGEPFDVRGTEGDKVGKFVCASDRCRRWEGERDLWLHGYWFWDWADERLRVTDIDAKTLTVTLAEPHHHYGYREGQWFYAFNALSELDRPGEWCLDRRSGTLYFWPPSRPKASTRPVLSNLVTLVSAADVSHVTFRNLTFEACRGTAVELSGGSNVSIVACTFRHLSDWAVKVKGGTDHTVMGCDIHHVGGGGVELEGGDRKRLTPGNHTVQNCHIHHYATWAWIGQPAVRLLGVGHRVRRNLIHDAPHEALDFKGNDHLIELNEIFTVCTGANDAGAVYGGRDWTGRGNVIQHNYIHDLPGAEDEGCNGVYLDDMLSGITVYGNVFQRITGNRHKGAAVNIGGGRDNTVANNIFLACTRAVHLDARGLGWAKAGVTGQMKQRLDAVPYDKPPWSERYPELLRLWQDEPGAPKGNVVETNIAVETDWENGLAASAVPFATIKSNLTDDPVRFVDLDKRDFRLAPGSRALGMGFKQIPVEKIGPYKSKHRASWPLDVQR